MSFVFLDEDLNKNLLCSWDVNTIINENTYMNDSTCTVSDKERGEKGKTISISTYLEVICTCKKNKLLKKVVSCEEKWLKMLLMGIKIPYECFR